MVDFIINPIAGGKNGEKIKSAIPIMEDFLRQNSVEYTFHFTHKKNEAKEITSSLIERGATSIVVVGGDGTLHEVINGFTNFDNTALGIIPLGTGNDFASALNIPLDPIKALELIFNNTPKFTDFMQMPTVRGLNVIGMGLDVEVLKRYEQLKKKTKFGYTKCLLKTLIKFDHVKFTTEIDGKKKEYRSFIACVANGHCFGGGINICPNASPIDNNLDFVAVDKVNKFVMLKLLIKLLKKKIHTTKQFYSEKISKLKIIPFDKNYTINVDGELYENIPFEIVRLKNGVFS